MTLRFKVLTSIFLWGPNPDSLKFHANFNHQELTCSVRIEAAGPLEADNLPPTHKFYAKADYIEFTVSDNVKNQSLKTLIDACDYIHIDELLRSVANRCIRSFRNLGHAPHLHELPKNDSQDPKKRLFQLRVDVGDNHETWKQLIPIPKDDGLLFLALMESQSDTSTNLNVFNLPDIEEAIQDNRPPAPEEEFRINAVEHLALKNCRLALLESVIGLEIVLTRFLKEYFRVYKKTPKQRIDKFLAPQLGLTSRLAGVLDLTLSEEDFRRVDLEKVMKAVEWRNSITHKTGHLPSNLNDDTVEDGILKILELTDLLARKAIQISASPETKEISNYLHEKYGMGAPNVWIFPKHRVVAELTVFGPPLREFPDGNTLHAIVADLIKKRSEQDQRFIAEEHLFFSFFDFPNHIRARWRKGKLELIERREIT